MRTTMKFIFAFGLILLSTLVVAQPSLSLLVVANSTQASSKTLTVPDEYPTIASAIGNSTSGDTIIVKKGTYRENPTVDKAIKILGEDPNVVTIIGNGGVDRGAQPVVNVTTNDVTISGFTIQSINYTTPAMYATGINVGGGNCTISGNIIVSTYYGIFSAAESSITISQNTILSAKKEGVRICGGTNNTLTGNIIALNAQSGIALDGYGDSVTYNKLLSNNRGLGLGAGYSLVFGNEISGNSESGIYIASSKSIIAANNLTKSKYGIYFTSFFAAPNNNTFYHNNILNNTNAVATSSIFNKQFWDNGAEGNYWSDYNATTQNTSYTAYTGNADTHPLDAPYTLPDNTAEPAKPLLPEASNGNASMWHFDEVGPNGATPDAFGNNNAILTDAGGGAFSPVLVDGEVGKAARFNGTDYIYVTASSTLNFQKEITVDAWINVQQFKENVSYNNIFIECMRTPDRYPTRILGFSINGQSLENNNSIPEGALRAYFLDDKGIFNEIVTSDYVVPLNQWVHVVFARSVTNGMHIYVDGVEKNVEVTSGSQNSTANFATGSEFYVGHDSFMTIDELSVSTKVAQSPASTSAPTTSPSAEVGTAEASKINSILTKWWLWATVASGAAFLAAIALFIRRTNKKAP